MNLKVVAGLKTMDLLVFSEFVNIAVNIVLVVFQSLFSVGNFFFLWITTAAKYSTISRFHKWRFVVCVYMLVFLKNNRY